MTDTLWSPTADRIDRSALREYLYWLEVREGRPFSDHDALWAWSMEDLDRFWSSIVDYYEVEFSTPWTTVRTADAMPHALSGKKLEVPIKKLLRGTPPEKAVNIASVEVPDARRWYERFGSDRFTSSA
jgi:acetoacetyl-CoA synthetase